MSFGKVIISESIIDPKVIRVSSMIRHVRDLHFKIY